MDFPKNPTSVYFTNPISFMSVKYTEGKKMDDVFHKSTLICFTKGKDMLVRNRTTVKKMCIINIKRKVSPSFIIKSVNSHLFRALNFPDLWQLCLKLLCWKHYLSYKHNEGQVASFNLLLRQSKIFAFEMFRTHVGTRCYP